MKKNTYIVLAWIIGATLMACGEGATRMDNTTSSNAPNVADTSSTKMVSPSGQTLATKIEPETADETLMQTPQETVSPRQVVIVKPNYALIAKADSTKEDLMRYDFRYYKKNKSDAWELKTEEKNVLSEDILSVSDNVPLIRYEDFNQDGIKDLALLLSADGRGNEKYRLWLTQPDAQKMTRIVGFEQLSAPAINAKNKVIQTTESYHGGQTRETYRIEGEKIQFINGEETIVDRKTQKSFVRKYTEKEKKN